MSIVKKTEICGFTESEVAEMKLQKVRADQWKRLAIDALHVLRACAAGFATQKAIESAADAEAPGVVAKQKPARVIGGIIHVRDSHGTYVARIRTSVGLFTASCTMGPEQAAEAVARKASGASPFELVRIGDYNSWELFLVRETP